MFSVTLQIAVAAKSKTTLFFAVSDGMSLAGPEKRSDTTIVRLATLQRFWT
jgi:hypothetical protein